MLSSSSVTTGIDIANTVGALSLLCAGYTSGFEAHVTYENEGGETIQSPAPIYLVKAE